MFENVKLFIFTTFLVFFSLAASAENSDYVPEESKWRLPQEISDSNCQVTFDLDSTWHAFQGKTKNLSGKVWLKNPQDNQSITAKIILPVSSFDTDNSSRDKKMRKVMAIDKYSNVIFQLEKVENLCNPLELTDQLVCEVNIIGKLNIRGVEKSISFPAKVSKHNGKFEISGKEELDWSDYGVEDPSIFIAKLYKKVIVNFKISL